MKDRRFHLGLALTFAWLLFAAYMLLTQKHPTDLNAWGDFFAGFFAPLAFLWLVLGYLQQGDELRQSTLALKLQAEELKNSVEQQSRLVALSRERLQQEIRTLEDERERRRDAARPKIVPQYSGRSVSEGVVRYSVKLTNVGKTATKLRIDVIPALLSQSEHNRDIFPMNTEFNFNFQMNSSNSVVSITYLDSDGVLGEVRFTLREENERLLISDVQLV